MSRSKPAAGLNTISGGTIVWFRQDLRLQDNPALIAAQERELPVIPLYVWSPEEESPWSPGDASRLWLQQSLSALEEELKKINLCLIYRRGTILKNLFSIIEEAGADAVFWHRRYEPIVVQRDEVVERELVKHKNIIVKTFNASLLYEPWEIKQKNGKPYQVFSAFSKACTSYGEPPNPLSTPSKLIAPAAWPKSLSLHELQLEPAVEYSVQIKKIWPADTASAIKKLDQFIEQHLNQYVDARNRPDLPSVSRLSPYLHFGQLSPRQILHRVKSAICSRPSKLVITGAEAYLRELVWREFAYYLLFNFPDTPNKPLRLEYKNFSWQVNKKHLHAWQAGQTGYPIVDAGMRELLQTGWMHNRVRMIVASFLVKDLLISWQAGAQWFWQNLIDADLANNTLGWQWVAGCGADAAPYFRIFNPIKQSEKFDPCGNYIKKYLPELKYLPQEYIHAPWLAEKTVLRQAGIELGTHYPLPLVNHSQARARALAAWQEMRDNKAKK